MSFQVSSVISENVRFTPEVINAMEAFVQSKPFRGTIEERKAKFIALHTAMCEACDVDADLEFINVELDTTSVNSMVGRHEDGRFVIVMCGKLSVVTYLILIGGLMHLETHPERMKWAANLFKQFFPRSFARLSLDGPLLTS